MPGPPNPSPCRRRPPLGLCVPLPGRALQAPRGAPSGLQDRGGGRRRRLGPETRRGPVSSQAGELPTCSGGLAAAGTPKKPGRRLSQSERPGGPRAPGGGGCRLQRAPGRPGPVPPCRAAPRASRPQSPGAAAPSPTRGAREGGRESCPARPPPPSPDLRPLPPSAPLIPSTHVQAAVVGDPFAHLGRRAPEGPAAPGWVSMNTNKRTHLSWGPGGRLLESGRGLHPPPQSHALPHLRGGNVPLAPGIPGHSHSSASKLGTRPGVVQGWGGAGLLLPLAQACVSAPPRPMRSFCGARVGAAGSIHLERPE